jgi:hypothetical protein
MTDPNERSDARSDAGSMKRIETALAGLGAEHEPPPGWEARVLAAVGATRRRWWTYAAPGVALAAAAAVAVVVVGRHDSAPAVALNVDVVPSARFRGEEITVGDVARIAVSGGRGARAIWVYREGVKLVLRCPGDPTCRISEASTEVDLTLSSAGRYDVVSVTGDHLPTPTGDRGVDTAAARDAGLDVQQHPVNVTGR